MRICRVLTCVLPWIGIAVSPAFASVANAEEHGADAPGGGGIDWGQWTPSVAAGFSIFSQETTATVQGDFNTPAAGGRDRLRDVGRRGAVDGPAIPFSLELMAPPLDWLPAKPRFFIEAGYRWPREPRFLAARDQIFTPTTQGNRRLPKMEFFVRFDQMWWGGAGMAFQFDLAGYPVRLRPSFNYFGQVADFQIRVEERKFFGLSPTFVFRTETYHGFGPKLGGEIEMGRRGPLVFSLMVDAYLAFFPGTLSFQHGGLIQRPAVNPTVPDFESFEFDNLQVGGSMTFKVSWVGYAP